MPGAAACRYVAPRHLRAAGHPCSLCFNPASRPRALYQKQTTGNCPSEHCTKPHNQELCARDCSPPSPKCRPKAVQGSLTASGGLRRQLVQGSVRPCSGHWWCRMVTYAAATVVQQRSQLGAAGKRERLHSRSHLQVVGDFTQVDVARSGQATTPLETQPANQSLLNRPAATTHWMVEPSSALRIIVKVGLLFNFNLGKGVHWQPLCVVFTYLRTRH